MVWDFLPMYFSSPESGIICTKGILYFCNTNAPFQRNPNWIQTSVTNWFWKQILSLHLITIILGQIPISASQSHINLSLRSDISEKKCEFTSYELKIKANLSRWRYGFRQRSANTTSQYMQESSVTFLILKAWDSGKTANEVSWARLAVC